MVQLLLPFTPEIYYQDNQLNEYLWACLNIQRPLLSEYLRSNSTIEIKLLKGLLLEENPLDVLIKALNIQSKNVPVPFQTHPARYLRFCRQLLYGSVVRRRFRIFIIGEEGSGKSTLVSSLSDHIVNIPISDDDDGIGLISSKFSFLNLAYWKENDIDFILWKLKGTHSQSPNLDIFMQTNQSAAYFIVLDLSLPPVFEQITKLLNSIQIQSTPQTVFFIGTHVDNISNSESNLDSKLSSISMKLAGMIRSWSLGASQHRNVTIVQPDNGLVFWKLNYSQVNDIIALKQRVLEVGIHKSTSLLMPLTYAKLFGTVLQSKQLGDATTVAFSWDQFTEWGTLCGLIGDNLRDAALYLQLIGELVYFDSATSLDQEYLIAHPIVS